MFPCSDGLVSSRPQGAFRDAASQKPLRATCRPSKTASSIPEEWRASDGSIRQGIDTSPNSRSSLGNASAQFETGSARGQPRLAPRVRNPRVQARRPIQADEVEPSAHVSRCGIVVPDRDSFAVLASLRLSSANSSLRRAEVGSIAVHDRLLPGDYVNVLTSDFT
jgi:hypothetical protein